MSRLLALLLLSLPCVMARAADRRETPNVILIFADDLGYGDLGCYGSQRIRTPHIDRIAREGVRFTDFYVAQPVCSASRAALMTGCYPNRVGIAGALGPSANIGLHPKEMTLGELFKSKAYATAAIGKWHLGHRTPFLPTKRGFDEYFGLPYSNDMWPFHPEAKAGTYPNLPLMDGEKIVDANVTPETQATLPERYADRAIRFIEKNKARPFFLYLATSMPHVPLFAGPKFRGKSAAGLYGDVIEELDATVGRILETVKTLDLDNNTLVMFSSDNGPWLSYGNHSGSTGGLREGKGTVWEGGVRVPFVARWPGQIRAGSVCKEPAMTIDILPTMATIIRADLPPLPIDGLNIRAMLFGQPGAKSPQQSYAFYYNDNELQAVRMGPWKLVLPHTYRTMQGQETGKDGKPGRYKQVKVEIAELYDLENDPGEVTNMAIHLPNVMNFMRRERHNYVLDLGDSLQTYSGLGRREPGRWTGK